jgi:murein DD-endopeptidase MepM/ murein hydrolase activator NlpD
MAGLLLVLAGIVGGYFYMQSRDKAVPEATQASEVRVALPVAPPAPLVPAAPQPPAPAAVVVPQPPVQSAAAPQAQPALHAPGGGFSLPIDCQIGSTCWVLNYFDVDKGAGVHDFQCHRRTYDGHDGTDIAIRDRLIMAQGVPVLAAADGVVTATRDGERDGLYLEKGPGSTTGRNCGNAAIVDHGDGWRAEYCHMREGSVVVKPGMRVKRGARLGLVGLSGATEFPHVHFGVRWNGTTVDPFTGRISGEGCTPSNASQASLWNPSAKIPYEEIAIYAAGFGAKGVPMADFDKNAIGDPLLKVSNPNIVFWGAIFGIEAGDRLTLRIVDPTGAVLANDHRILDATMARWVPAITVRREGTPWAPGRYTGTIVLERAKDGGSVRESREAAVDMR